MGDYQHGAALALVGAWAEEQADRALHDVRRFAGNLGSEYVDLLPAPVPAVINGFRLFILAPSGSKFGWPEDERWDQLRDKFKETFSPLSSGGVCIVEWGDFPAEVVIWP